MKGVCLACSVCAGCHVVSGEVWKRAETCSEVQRSGEAFVEDDECSPQVGLSLSVSSNTFGVGILLGYLDDATQR